MDTPEQTHLLEYSNWLGLASLIIAIYQLYTAPIYPQGRHPESVSSEHQSASEKSVPADLYSLASKATEKMIKSGVLRFSSASEGGKTVVMVGEFRNRSASHFDMERFKNNALQGVLNSGLAQVIDVPADQPYDLEIIGTLYSDIVQDNTNSRVTNLDTHYTFVIKGVSLKGTQLGLWEQSVIVE